MNLNEFKDQVIESVVNPMLSFMEEYEIEDYTSEDVDRCKTVLFNYLEALAHMDSPSDEEIMEQVKKLVLELNELSEQTDYAMIETDERESICEIIQSSAVECGLTAYEDDITEQWREW